MKSFVACFIVAMFALVAGIVASSHAAPTTVESTPAAVNLKADHIECKEIKIKSANGKHAVTIAADSQMAGIWIDSGKGPCIAIYEGMGQGAVIGIYNDTSKDQGIPFALVGSKPDGTGVQIVTTKEGSDKPDYIFLDAKNIASLGRFAQALDKPKSTPGK